MVSTFESTYHSALDSSVLLPTKVRISSSILRFFNSSILQFFDSSIPPDLRSDRIQALIDAFVATVNLVDVVDDAGAFG